MAFQVSDPALLPGASRDEEFPQWYDAYRARLFRFCHSRLSDAHEAEDVAQEAFARAWRAQLCLTDQDRAYAWLRVVAGNLCTDILRRRSRCQTSPEIEPSPAFGADDPVLRESDNEAVRLALARLSDRHRAVLEERARTGATYEQMASRAGTSVATVESLLWRARQALKRELMAIAGPEGLLAGLPVVSFAVRRFHYARARLAAWQSQLSQFVATPQFLGSASLVVGLCPAMCAVGLSGWGPGSGQVATPVAVVSVPAAFATQPTPDAPAAQGTSDKTPANAGPASSSQPFDYPAGAATASTTPKHVVIQSAVSSTKPDNRRDKSMPIHVSVGSDSVGVDPGALVGPVVGAAQAALTGR